MNYLFAAACSLAVMAGPSIHQAQAKTGGSARSAKAAIATTNSPTVTVRDHRGRFGTHGGGVRVCKGRTYCIIRY
jgi:hypothetical protein